MRPRLLSVWQPYSLLKMAPVRVNFPTWENSLFSFCRDKTHYQVKGSSHPDAPQVAFTCPFCEVPLDSSGEPADYVVRCSDCNTAFMRWKRMRVWKEGVPRASQENSRWKVRFVTFTKRHKPIDTQYNANGQLMPCPTTIEEETRPMVENFRKMKRSVHFKRLAPGGGAWVAECTKKVLKTVDLSHTRLEGALHDVDTVAGSSTGDSRPRPCDVVRRVPRMKFQWSVHPHIHTLLVGDFIDIPALSGLARKYGFDNVDVKLVGDSMWEIRNCLNYISVYLGKDQPLPRSRDSFGLVRSMNREVRLEHEEARRLIIAEQG